jgi:hypothetical protein
VLDDTTCASIQVDIAVEYCLDGEKMPNAESLKAWAASGVLTHAWPYWREFCHSMMVKMSLPVIMVPLLNLLPPTAPAALQVMQPLNGTEPKPAKKARAKKKE